MNLGGGKCLYYSYVMDWQYAIIPDREKIEIQFIYFGLIVQNNFGFNGFPKTYCNNMKIEFGATRINIVFG